LFEKRGIGEIMVCSSHELERVCKKLHIKTACGNH
jgi:hypothetical protein